jgi:hypothetical protein
MGGLPAGGRFTFCGLTGGLLAGCLPPGGRLAIGGLTGGLLAGCLPASGRFTISGLTGGFLTGSLRTGGRLAFRGLAGDFPPSCLLAGGLTGGLLASRLPADRLLAGGDFPAGGFLAFRGQAGGLLGRPGLAFGLGALVGAVLAFRLDLAAGLALQLHQLLLDLALALLVRSQRRGGGFGSRG